MLAAQLMRQNQNHISTAGTMGFSNHPAVRKTGRAVVAHEAVRAFGAGSEIAATLQEEASGVWARPIPPCPSTRSLRTPLWSHRRQLPKLLAPP